VSYEVEGSGPGVVEVAKYAAKWSAINGMVQWVSTLAFVAFVIHSCGGAP